MNKFFLIYIAFVIVCFINICYCLGKELWAKFCVSIGRCPRCFRTFGNYNDYGISFGYCQKHITEEAYYEDKTKVIFKEDLK